MPLQTRNRVMRRGEHLAAPQGAADWVQHIALDEQLDVLAKRDAQCIRRRTGTCPCALRETGVHPDERDRFLATGASRSSCGHVRQSYRLGDTSMAFPGSVSPWCRVTHKPLCCRSAPQGLCVSKHGGSIMRGQVRAERGRGSTALGCGARRQRAHGGAALRWGGAGQRPYPWPRSWLRFAAGGGVKRLGAKPVVRGVVRTGGGVRWCW